MKSPTHNIDAVQAEGLAALGICESLLLALKDLDVLNDKDVSDLLGDVVATHMEAAGISDTPERHIAVVAILQRMLAGKEASPH